jgi:hypothetical protein
MLRVNAPPIIPDPQPKLPLVIPDFHFDPLRLCVLEGVAQRLACNPIDFGPQYRIQVSRRAFYLHMKVEFGPVVSRLFNRRFDSPGLVPGGSAASAVCSSTFVPP